MFTLQLSTPTQVQKPDPVSRAEQEGSAHLLGEPMGDQEMTTAIVAFQVAVSRCVWRLCLGRGDLGELGSA